MIPYEWKKKLYYIIIGIQNQQLLGFNNNSWILETCFEVCIKISELFWNYVKTNLLNIIAIGDLLNNFFLDYSKWISLLLEIYSIKFSKIILNIFISFCAHDKRQAWVDYLKSFY